MRVVGEVIVVDCQRRGGVMVATHVCLLWLLKEYMLVVNSSSRSHRSHPGLGMVLVGIAYTAEERMGGAWRWSGVE